MSDKADRQRRIERLHRLRKLGLQRGAANLEPKAPTRQSRANDRLPGEPVETRFGATWVRTAIHPLDVHPDLAEFLQAGPEALAALALDPSLAGVETSQVAFIDTETTGLSLDTSTYTFMIGIGTYEDLPSEGSDHDESSSGGPGATTRAFVVRQFFMRSPEEERAQLALVEETLDRCTGVVSFNGKAFDLPLIQNRFILARMPLPLLGAAHLDLLPPARRIWRNSIGSCSLGNLEREILHRNRTEEDVPGWMIPGIYRDYYQTGAGLDLLTRVFYHNLEDIVSMPILASQMAALFSAERYSARMDEMRPAECISLGRCYERLAWTEASELAYHRALERSEDDESKTMAYRHLADLFKRQGRREEAAHLWEEWIGNVHGEDLTPYVELAKHSEWVTSDLRAARGWTAWAKQIAESWPGSRARQDTIDELAHRLERLERKLAVRSLPPDDGEGN